MIRATTLMAAFAISVSLIAFSTSQAQAMNEEVDCDKGESIQARLDNNVEDGDTLEVSGTCSESIVIDKDRITLDCLAGANITSTGDVTISVSGSNAIISGCAISGVQSAVKVLSGGSARLEGNTISGADANVRVLESSHLLLINGNQITGARLGVAVGAASSAVIVSNNISNNSQNGVLVTNSGSAHLVGNEIKDNGGNGVGVVRSSTAVFSLHDLFGNAANQISGNGGSGILCFSPAALNFGAPQDFTGGNTGGNTGLFCSVRGTP